ncbi:hypothetical protein ACT80S_18415 [Ramlibacter sp. MAHUQ-53]|uniref:hypothetical protein n=1 Tax=unclassified Ramlibacter TaxID=2617605 RepID=UPI0036307284
MTGIPGFGEAMEAVGWAIYDPEEGSVTLPNFAEYNTSGEARSIGAKTAAERQREYRERQKAKAESEAQTSCESVTESDVTRNATRDVTSDVTRNRREEKRREEIEPNGSIPPYPLGLDVEAWEQWVAYRKQIKKPLKPASMAAAQEAMLEFGAGQAEAVRQSIANGWQGLFAPKGAAAAKPVNRQGAVEARNRAVAAEWLASEGVA